MLETEIAAQRLEMEYLLSTKANVGYWVLERTQFIFYSDNYTQHEIVTKKYFTALSFQNLYFRLITAQKVRTALLLSLL